MWNKEDLMNPLIILLILTVLVGWLLLKLTLGCCCALIEAVTVLAPLMRWATRPFRALGRMKTVLPGRSHMPGLQLVPPPPSFVQLHSRYPEPSGA